MKISAMRLVTGAKEVRALIEKEFARTGGIFRLTPVWVGRPGMQPGRRLKLADEYMNQVVAVNERWLASVTYADNGVYNSACPEDHGLSYIVIDECRVLFRDAIEYASDLLLGDKKWDVLAKFFDNWNRIPHHMHPCDEHIKDGLLGKPESYYFPIELNMNRSPSPATGMGIDPTMSDSRIMNHLLHYFSGENRMTDLANTLNLIPGTGWFMPPCTLHAPGSFVTYELQSASDAICIPESRFDDLVMPPDLLDRDLPVSVAENGLEKVGEYILSMIHCPNSGNFDNFRQEYFRPPVTVRDEAEGSQSFVAYRCGKASQNPNPDVYSGKKTIVNPSSLMELSENAAFGGIMLSGHGRIWVPGKEPVQVEAASMYPTRDDLGGDEFFVAAGAASNLRVECGSIERLVFCQHFSSESNPQATELAIPEYGGF